MFGKIYKSTQDPMEKWTLPQQHEGRGPLQGWALPTFPAISSKRSRPSGIVPDYSHLFSVKAHKVPGSV